MKLKVILVLLCTLVSFGCGYSSPGSTAPQPGVTPAISQLAPDNASSGGPGFTLTVNGSNFASNAVVDFNGQNMTTTFVSAAQVTAAVPSTAITSPGTVPISVTNPGTPASGPYGGGTLSETSPAMNFTVN